MKTKILNIIFILVATANFSCAGNLSKKILNPTALATEVISSDSIEETVVDTVSGFVIEEASVPIAIQTASALGVTASTGTAISSLSGAAAESATLYAVGSSASAAIATVTGITIAPAVVGGAIVAGAGYLTYKGIKLLFLNE